MQNFSKLSHVLDTAVRKILNIGVSWSERCKKSGNFERENRGSLILLRKTRLTIRNLIWLNSDITSDSDNDEDELKIL